MRSGRVHSGLTADRTADSAVYGCGDRQDGRYADDDRLPDSADRGGPLGRHVVAAVAVTVRVMRVRDIGHR